MVPVFSSKLSATIVLFAAGLAATLAPFASGAENWPRWRGPDGSGVSSETQLPRQWSTTKNVRWKVEVPGNGSSSPIVWGERLFITSALDEGARRLVHCLDRATGQTLWRREIDDEWPEITSALTGHAAATPVTDGERVVAMFGNAGVVCYSLDGQQRWRRRFGEFESELGLASSPMLFEDRVILVCDHDGTRFGSFDSFLIALDLKTGEEVWNTDRRGLFRSWSTPIIVPTAGGASELIVNAQEAVRGYDPRTGKELWRIDGMTGWVTPSPVFGHGLVFAASGKDGPTLALRPGGRGDVTGTHVAWQHDRGAPYVCSPLLYGDYLYVHNEHGVLTCFEAATGAVRYRERLAGKFVASGIAAAGAIYITNDEGLTYTIAAGPEYRLIATNTLEEEVLASPAVSDGCIFLRTQRRLYCVARAGD